MNVSADLAQQLHDAGLVWKPKLHDFFMVPDTSVADRLFVLADMMAGMEVLQGYQAITFNGATEWALDYVLKIEALWIPTEAQIRTLLQQALPRGASLRLLVEPSEYVCELGSGTARRRFAAATAADAYGQAWLALKLAAAS